MTPPQPDGAWMHALARELWPFNRSLTGDGVRQTLAVLHRELPDLVMHEVASGTPAFDWSVPDEWNLRRAWLEGPNGERVIDSIDSNIHVVGYSTPIDSRMSLADLNAHVHSDPDVPDAIPYVTSYYNPTWGLCMTHRQRETLQDGEYRAVIESSLHPGSLTYGELLIPGECEEEVLVSTYICHPSLANNELSGPVVATALAKWISALPDRRYSYRFVFIPETIGALVFTSRNLDHLKQHVVAGFNLTCIGDDGDYSYLASRSGNTPIDRIARRVIQLTPQPVVYSYLDRGSDERQYGAPGIDLPLISLMRTKYGAYSEYHTSLDDLDHVVTPSGLQGGFGLVRDCIDELESSDYFQSTVLGEPQLGKRGLYHTVHARTVADEVLLRTHILAYSDGQHSLADMAELFEISKENIGVLIQELVDHGLLVRSHLTRVSG